VATDKEPEKFRWKFFWKFPNPSRKQTEMPSYVVEPVKTFLFSSLIAMQYLVVLCHLS